MNGQTYPWAWTADNFTDPEYRGRGLSTLLQRTATKYLHEHGIGRGSVFSTDITLHIFSKLGFELAGYAKRFLMMRSASPIVEAHVRNLPLRRLLTAGSAPLALLGAASLSVWNRLLAPGTIASTSESFPDRELQAFLSRLAPSNRVHFAMDAGLLRVKLALAQRAGSHTLHLIHDSDSGNCVAYVIIRERFADRPLAGRYRGFKLMTLADFALDETNPRAASGVVATVVASFFASDCQALEIISSDRRIGAEARRRGMWPIGRGMSFNYSVPPSWCWPSDLSRPEHWPLTHFCGDAFSY